MSRKPPSSPQSTFLQLALPVRAFTRRFSGSWFVVAALIILVMGRINSDFSERVRTRTLDIIYPLVFVVSHPVETAVHAGESLRSWINAHEESIRLKAENNWLRKQIDAAAQAQAENRYLRTLLHLAEKTQHPFITARVVGDSSGPYVKNIILNAGMDQGLKKNQAVMNERGLIGRISEVGQQTARVMLLSDVNSRIPVISSYSRERGMLVGTNTKLLHLIYLPKDSDIRKGEILFTSGDGELFPSGLPIGTIVGRAKDAVVVAPFVDWNRMEFVQVVDY